MQNFFYTLLLVLILSLHSGLFAQDKDLGLGIIVGEPTGMSGKYQLGDNKAIDFALGFSVFGDKSRLSFHADYLYQLNEFIPSEDNIPFYYGFGLRLRTHSREAGSFGVRGVGGLIVNLRNMPLELFFEAAPVFQLLPDTRLKFDAAIGGRYYFQIR